MSRPATDDAEFLTVQQAAERLNLKPGMIYRLTASGRIPVYRYGRRTIRLRVSDLEVWTRAHKET